jgi:predicted dehydrogenase
MGAVYLQALLENREKGTFRLVGVVDPFPERCPHLDFLQSSKIPIYRTLEDFYSRLTSDLAIISSPIHFHCDQTCLALGRGSDVLCEKPPAATVQEVRRMLDARVAARRRVAVGYQWSFSAAIQSLKNDIIAGEFGRARRLRCLYLWPRDEAYYRRNDWAGKRQDAQGRWILDSPANNAMAHDLHNMFYILGRTKGASEKPVRVEAELYRANDIENFDTAALRCVTERGVEILFYVSHAAALDLGPVFFYEFERGTVTVRGRDTDIRADFWDGGSRNYGCPDSERLKKLWDMIDTAGTNAPPACGLEASLSHTLCLNGAQDSTPIIQEFPPSLLKVQGEPGKRMISVEGLTEVLFECYELSRLPSELGVPWSQQGKIIDLSNYENFPQKI